MSNIPHASVSVIRCSDYTADRVLSAVRQAVDLLGGMQVFVKPGERVLIKPNLLKANPPEDAVTTHPEVVRAVIRLVQETGAMAMVGDSPGFGDINRVCEKTGIMDVVREEGAELVDFEEAITVKNKGKFQRFEIARRAYEADAIINLPKLKTHGMTMLTGAVKNLFGCIPGKRKVQWHFNTGVNHDHFMQMLVEVYALLKPRLSIMDAIVGMEGNGPGSGDPRTIGVVMAGADGAAMDVIASRLVGIAPERLPLIQAAAQAGIGQTLPANISVLGEPLVNVEVKNFKRPPFVHTEWPIPEWLRRSFKSALTSRPKINASVCNQCGVCMAHCPQTAITKKGNRLELRYRDCIRCFCCQELCPRGGITIKKGWALRLLG